ncbi:MAG: hypothetical protein LC793_05910 [Thermomicrobia bacterium]|nr:hypothetical protein [Thermomicrobia bacterium]
MKVTVKNVFLQNALAVIKPSIATKSSLPVLKAVLLDASAVRFRVIATNLDSTGHKIIGGDIDAYGAICVPGKKFLAYTKLIPKDALVTLERDWRHETLSVTFNESRATFRCINAKDFPNLPNVFDSGPYETLHEQEQAALQAERGQQDRRAEAAKQAEYDRIAALPDAFVYRYQVGYTVHYGETTFPTLVEAVTQWYDDQEYMKAKPQAADFHYGESITDKFGTQVVRYYADTEQLYAELVTNAETDDDDEGESSMDEQALDALLNSAVMHGNVDEHNELVTSVSEETVFVDLPNGRGTIEYRVKSGPPPGTPCDHDVPVIHTLSTPHEHPIQEQEELQHDEQQVTPPTKKEPRAEKLRFGFKPETIEKFFTKAMRKNTEVRYAFSAKHNGHLIAARPVGVESDTFYLKLGDTTIGVPKAEVKYLEFVG